MAVYTEAFLMAYCVPTACAAGGATISGWSPGNACDDSDIKELLDKDLDTDAKIRLLRLAAVVKAAKAEADKDASATGPTTLKIFTAPEFYFRPEYATSGVHAYSEKVYNAIINSLKNLFLRDAYKDWLIIGGTVVWQKGIIFQNDAPWVYCETDKALSGLWIVSKMYDSNIDGILRPEDIPPQPAVIDSTYIKEYWEWAARYKEEYCASRSALRTDAAHRNHILLREKTGMEICLEHLNGVLRTALKKTDQEWAKRGVDLHITINAGMCAIPCNIGAKDNGYFFRNDGCAPTYAGQPPVQLYKITGYTVLVGGNPTKTSVSNPAGFANITLTPPTKKTPLPAGPQCVPIPRGYTGFEQEIVFYKSVPYA